MAGEDAGRRSAGSEPHRTRRSDESGSVPLGPDDRIRPRTSQHHALLESAKSRIDRIDNRQEVTPRPDPVDLHTLRQRELRARREVGRIRRERRGAGALIPAMIFWGLTRLDTTRGMRTVNLFFFHYGTVMAAGAAYMMFFSVAAMLVAGFSIAGIVVGGNEQLQQDLVAAVNTAIPGLIDTGDGGGLASQEQLFRQQGFSAALGVSLVVLVVTSLSWLHGLRSGVRSIFDRPLMAENIIIVKLRDLGLMLIVAVLLLGTVGLWALTTDVVQTAMEFLGWDEGPLMTVISRAGIPLVTFLMDGLLALLLLRVASRVVIPVAVLWQSVLIAAVGASLLRMVSGQLFAGSANPILDSFTAVLGLFFYFFLFSLVILLAASWGAVGVARRAERRSERRASGARSPQ
ncbi:MAG: YihY/virulence factor BrkB family protein [Nesterenkonia sp.]|uniref:YihY/virulence factor BrkB family protein n=1 Tax=Nesterenkonia marinintestina TaxID=2979865 RepID=UPI0021BFC47F|nr:YihY/virulence factor BrkB family protein [Nesterenkonia sp. GX14115]MDO5493853.1 YihY/virulence factor BrkB family protein [Nesterenkonia sp.]